MSETTFTFRVDSDLKQAFSHAAKSCERTGAQLLRDFMRQFVQNGHGTMSYDAWFRSQVQEGLDQANAGELISADEVEAEARAWRAETRRKMSRS